VPVEGLQGAVVEHRRDQPHVLDHGEVVAGADRHPGRFLAPVLEGVEAEVDEVGDGLARGVDADDPAGLLGGVRVELVGDGHGVEPTDAGSRAEGSRSRQAPAAAARSRSTRPSTTRRSPPAVPRSRTGTPAASARRTTPSTRPASTHITTRDGDSEKSSPWPSPPATSNPGPEATAI